MFDATLIEETGTRDMQEALTPLPFQGRDKNCSLPPFASTEKERMMVLRDVAIADTRYSACGGLIGDPKAINWGVASSDDGSGTTACNDVGEHCLPLKLVCHSI